jgi:hypothetical protein
VSFVNPFSLRRSVFSVQRRSQERGEGSCRDLYWHLPFQPAKTIIAKGREILELDWFYKLDISVIYAVAIVLIAGAAEFGT